MGRLRRGTLPFLMTLSLLATGCVGLFAGDDLGRRAELVGDYHRAYDLYVRAASSNPSSRMLSLAIARVAPQAANYWEDQAHRAADQGRYADAWRMFMRVLEIRPDHPSAPHLIRRLERDHPEEVGPVRLAWLKWGADVLTSPSLRLADARESGSKAPSSPPSTDRGRRGMQASAWQRESFASVDRRVPPTQMESPEPAVGSPTRAREGGGPREREVAAGRRPEVRSSDVEATSKPLAQEAAGQSVVVSSEGVGGVSEQTGLREVAGLTSQPANPRSAVVPDTQSAMRDGEGRSAGGRGTGGVPGYRTLPSSVYLVIRTLSRKDRRFPNKLEVLDGLTIEVRDTDDNPDADYNVHLGGERIRKLKGVRIGEPRMVVGRSGRVYEIVLLNIIDERQTIRFGVRAAKGRPAQHAFR